MGKYPEGLKEIPLITVTAFTGYIFSNSFIAFAFNLVIATTVLIPIFWALTWQLLWENRIIIFGIALLSFYDTVIAFLGSIFFLPVSSTVKISFLRNFFKIVEYPTLRCGKIILGRKFPFHNMVQ